MLPSISQTLTTQQAFCSWRFKGTGEQIDFCWHSKLRLALLATLSVGLKANSSSPCICLIMCVGFSTDCLLSRAKVDHSIPPIFKWIHIGRHTHARTPSNGAIHVEEWSDVLPVVSSQAQLSLPEWLSVSVCDSGPKPHTMAMETH